MENVFLTIPEFIKKYDVADSKIRRRLYRLKNINLAQYQESVKESKTYFGYIIQLDETWWSKELKASQRKAEQVEPPKRVDERISGPAKAETDGNFFKEIIKNQQKQIEDNGRRLDEFLKRYGEINILLKDLQSKLYLTEGKESSEISEEIKNNEHA